MRFDDYHRTVVGYHGTRLSVALAIVSRSGGFKKSENADDWLGHGVYFWEYAPQQAFWWAERRARRHKWTEPIAIVASMIRLGFCFDLLDPYNVKYLGQIHRQFVEVAQVAGEVVPENANNHKYLDCSVFQYAYAAIESGPDPHRVDTARAVYVPKGARIWKRSWISTDAHIQICVRNPACILGTWLHHPINLERNDEPDEVATIQFESEDQESGEESQATSDGGPNSTPSEGKALDAAGGGQSKA